MGRRGPEPQYAKREAFAKLIAEGVPSARACRIVGICRRTGTRWRNGRRIKSGGRVLNLPPVITVSPNPQKGYSPRYLSEDERIRLADLRRERHTMREIGARMGRSASTICRELRRGADAAGRYRPFEAHRRALDRRRRHRPSRLARDPVLRDWVAGKLTARPSPEQIAHELRQAYPDEPERWLCAETIYQAVYRPDLGRPAPRAPGAGPASPPAATPRTPARRGPALRSAHRHDLDRRAPGNRARARRAWPLGGRSHHRRGQRLGDHHDGRACHAVHPARASARQARLGERPRRCRGGPRRPVSRDSGTSS